MEETEKETNHRSNAAMAVCTNCSVALAGPICHACGEEQPSSHDLSVKHFFHEALDELAHFDAKVPATLKNLIFRPGFLSSEYFAGRKTRYLRPLRFYLIVFTLNFFLYSFFKPVAVYDFSNVVKQQTTRDLEQAIQKIAKKRKVEPQQVVEIITVRWQKGVSVLQLLNPFILAGVLTGLFGRYRKYFIEHLVFSLNYVTFTFLFSCLIWPINLYIGIDLTPSHWVLVLGVALISGVYLFCALSEFYKSPRNGTLFRTVIVLLAAQIAFATVLILAVLIAIFSVIPW